MSNHQGQINRPYRKASEYLVASNNSTKGSHLQSNQENDRLNEKLIALTRKLERTEVEFAQSREYFNNELHRFEDQQFKVNEQYRKLQSSYTALQSRNRELEHSLTKINSLQVEKERLVREVNEINNKLAETKNALFKAQEENERLRKDCNLAVQLLKCNRPNYQVQKHEQLPNEVQDQINSYKVKLENYNEYINPCADASDTDSEGERVKDPDSLRSDHVDKHVLNNKGNEIPVEFLAEALKKPENVHLNLEPSDYIQDPVLHSVYKAHYTERKLIKPNYDRKTTAPLETDQSQPSDQSVTVPKKEENSPWELAPSRRVVARCESVDDESPAGAYGAYSVSSRRKAPTKAHRFDRPETSSRNETSGYDARIAPVQLQRPPSPEDLCFRAPAEPIRSGISGFFNKPAKDSPSASLSSGSSKKSTPIRVRGKEKATAAETSSLLNQSQSDDDDGSGVMVEISHYPNNQTSPEKRYTKERVVGQEKNSLLAADDDAQYELPPPPSEIELEWEPDIEAEENPEQFSVDSHGQVSKHDQPAASETQPDLLLSYADVESPIKSLNSDLEALMNQGTGKYEEESSYLDTNQYLLPPNPSGQLLSEIVTNNPSLSSFLMSSAPHPPPPEQYASGNEQMSSRPTVPVDNKSAHLAATDEPEVEHASLPVRVDDQIEVIDLDEEPRKPGSRRRNSFDQAREFGNVLNHY